MDTLTAEEAYRVMYEGYTEILSVNDICKMLGIGRRRAYLLINSGQIKRIPCGRNIKVAKVAVIYYVLQSAQE